MSKAGEFEIIERYLAPLASDHSFGLKDDAAYLEVPDGEVLVMTQDAIAEAIHFFKDDDPALIAKKALRTNLSDMAAKAAQPMSFSLALGLGEAADERWLEAFGRGLKEDCENFSLTINGGDTFRTGGPSVISVTLVGHTPAELYRSRLSANPDEAIFVSGTIGDGTLGLLAHQGELSKLDEVYLAFLKERYLLPQPRLEMRDLLRTYATAAMDVSDGLVGDLEKLCAASGVGAQVSLEQIPFSEAGKQACATESKLKKRAITGGDDYEILFTVPRSEIDALLAAASALPFSVSRIGETTKETEVIVVDGAGQPVELGSKSYDHSGDHG